MRPLFSKSSSPGRDAGCASKTKWGVVGLWGLFLGGCGYTLGYRTPPSVKTIAVPLFDNTTFPLRREVEYDLTAAVRKEIQARTSLQLTDMKDADLVVHGAIHEFRERLIAEGRRDQKLESTIVIGVDLVVEDYKNGKRWEDHVRVYEPLSVDIGETLDEARTRAISNLAEKILLALESWEEGS